MISIIQLSEFLGWCSVINLCILAITSLFVTVFNSFIINVHSKMMNIDSSELPKLYFKYLSHYKVAVLIFNLVPYAALKIMV